MIKIYHKTTKDKELKTIDRFKVGSWIRVRSPNDAEIMRVVKEFGLDEGLVRDALDPNEVPRLELDNEIVYIYTRVPHIQEGRTITLPLLICMAPEFLMTISCRELPFIQEFISGKKDFNTTQKAKLLLQLFSEINKLYQHFMNHINKRVREVDVRITRIQNRDIVQFVRFEKILNDFLSALSATNIVLKNLLKGRVIDFFEEDKDLLEDMFLSNEQLIVSAGADLKHIVNIRDAYSTIISQDLNRIIKILTVLTVVLNVPVLVSGFYGMNMALPGAGSPHAFWWVLGLTVVLSALLLLIFIYNKWIK